MNEMKHGYPNPDYRREDVGLEPIEMNAVIQIDDKEYRELVGKAAMYDTLKAAIKAMGKVDDDVVRALTGTLNDESKAEADKNWDYFWKERQKNEEMKLQMAALERTNNELREILRQNGIPKAEQDDSEVDS